MRFGRNWGAAMSEMTPERFVALLDSYGAAPDRWPEDERAAALALLSADPDASSAYERESLFDDLLTTSRAPLPSIALTQTVLAKAPVRRFRKRLLTRWTGLALAGAGAAGLLCGSAVAAMIEPVGSVAGYSHDATAFGAIDDEPEET